MPRPEKRHRPSTGQVTRRQFELLMSRAFEELPRAVQARLDNVAILVQDWPTRDQLQVAELQHPEDLFGLYEGVPLVDRRIDDTLLPDRITIFRGPILAACATPEEVVQEVRATVRHEVAHFFGMDEAQLDEIEGR